MSDFLADLPTPCLLLDESRLQRNLHRMAERAAALRVHLRPHVKTAKAVDVFAQLPSARTHGITVSTLAEAEHFAAAGFTDQLYAVAITPDKLPRAAALLRRGIALRLAVDDPTLVPHLREAAGTERVTFPMCVEVDCGEHRSGRAPDDPALLDLGRALHEGPGTTLAGVFTHGGHSYLCRSPDQIAGVAAAERDAATAAAARLGTAGLPCAMVSVGSTPTMTHADHLEGATEVRSGVAVFGDLYQVALGTCAREDIAVTVLATVIGHQRQHRRILIDAGGLALSKDRSTQALGPEGDLGYGSVCTAAGRPIPGLVVRTAYQEHGVLPVPDSTLFEQLPLGTRLRVEPNHACMTCAAHDGYHVLRHGAVAAYWPRVNGW